MSHRDQTALAGLVIGAVGVAVLQSFVNDQARTLGVSTAAVGLLIATVSRKL